MTPLEALNLVMTAYLGTKILNPVTTTPKKGVNVHELVKATFPKEYKDLKLFTFAWDNLDGVLDYLYGLRETCHVDTTAIIKLIEDNCEVKQ